MNNYNIFLLLPIFKNLNFLQNEIFNKENFISRSAETRSLGEALNSKIFYEKIINISIPKSSLFFSSTVINEIISNFNLDVIDLIIVDCSLSPVQHRNLEKAFNKKIIDRTQLIIEIFGLRAKTKEGMLQVELANLSFQKTRLVRSWTHLERQRGGLSKVGGPGESQLELDKRIIDTKIKQIKNQLNNILIFHEVNFYLVCLYREIKQVLKLQKGLIKAVRVYQTLIIIVKLQQYQLTRKYFKVLKAIII